MKKERDEVVVNGKKYVLAESVSNNAKAKLVDGMEYCIVRTYSAGVFAGYFDRKSLEGQFGTVKNARRIWQWAGAASLSQLAQDGTSSPEHCKFPCEVDEVILTDIIEVIPCTEKAKKSIDGVKVWTA